ncbi:hypothetical protein QQS21_002909 [Conoideocrella luteorostrata]|uniref:Transaldolase n=1 Tax=Conoideocrella luteorostrata TaxID=1105319 RepID=A0AAJ0CYD8_9HYPO|nr:hypothetical protein QQS21_002909 [Conoideocrella luteorostrata]
MDTHVAKKLGPFVDCTSNQAIAYFELTKLDTDNTKTLFHQDLITEAKADAAGRLKDFQNSIFEEFVVEILMVKLQIQFISSTTGYLRVQTNPKLSYSTRAIVQNAFRIIAIFKALAPNVDPKRVCIKVPAAWEGLQACEVISANGIATLATTVFCMEQAALAGAACCTYIAPYVNELKVHFGPVFLPPSFTSIDEVTKLAGTDHITIAPGLLAELNTTDANSQPGKLGKYVSDGPESTDWDIRDYRALIGDEAAWRLEFTRSGFGARQDHTGYQPLLGLSGEDGGVGQRRL